MHTDLDIFNIFSVDFNTFSVSILMCKHSTLCHCVTFDGKSAYGNG